MKKMRTAKLVCGMYWVVVLLLVYDQSWGEEDTDGTDRVYEAAEVLVTGSRLIGESPPVSKLPVPIASIPASISIVSEETVEDQGGTVLGDALRNVSGANTQTGFGVFDFFTIRGFDSLSSGLVLTDGIPEPEVSFYNLYNVSGVEVLKGPGAFLYGGNPLSGTVNLATKKPVFAPSFARAKASIGSFETYSGTFDLGTANESGDIAVRLNGLWQQSANYRNDKDNSTVAVNPTVRWRPGDRSLLDVAFEYVTSDYNTDSGLPVIDDAVATVPRKRSYQSPFDSSDQTTYRLRVDFETELTESIRLRNRAFYTDFDWPSSGTIFNGVFPNAAGSEDLSRSLLILDDHQTFVGNRIELEGAKRTGGFGHTVVAGLELAHLSDEFNLDVGVLPNIDLLTPEETATEPVFLIPDQSSGADSRSTVIAPYAVDQIQVNEKLQVLLGLRFDSIDYEDDVTGTKRDYAKLSPMLGAIQELSDGHSLYANASRAFAPPSSQVVGERKAEESAQLEVGLRSNLFADRVSTSVALYQLSKSNISILDETGLPRETGDQRSRGIELGVGLTPRRGWSSIVSYAYTDAELTEFTEGVLALTETGPEFRIEDRSGKTPAFAPAHILNGWSTWELGDLSIGAGIRYVGAQFIDEDNVFEIDGALTLDASLRYSLGAATLRINGSNLTDKEFYSRGFGTTSVIPANPLGVTIGVDWSL